MIINILGTKYTITETTQEKDVCLCNCDGYCDKTTKRIVITKFLREVVLWRS